jgi:hypothetical protein
MALDIAINADDGLFHACKLGHPPWLARASFARALAFDAPALRRWVHASMKDVGSGVDARNT